MYVDIHSMTGIDVKIRRMTHRRDVTRLQETLIMIYALATGQQQEGTRAKTLCAEIADQIEAL